MKLYVIPCLAGLLAVSACSKHDPRLPSQVPAPAVPIVPPVVAPNEPVVTPPPAPVEDTAELLLDAPRWEDAKRLETFCGAAMKRAGEAREKLQAEGDKRLVGAAALTTFDTIYRETDTASGLASLLVQVSPVSAVRETAATCDQAIAQLRAEVLLDRKVYDTLAAVDEGALEADLKRFRTMTLDDFRRSGVDKDEPTRARLAAIQGEMKKLSQDYETHLNEDTRRIHVTPDELAGMPADWLAAHPVGAEGKIAVTTDYPDYFPAMEYAKSAELRKALWEAYAARGTETNRETLLALLKLRKEVATLLGRPSWAAYAVEDMMARTPETVSRFIDELATAVRPRADKDLARLLAAKQKDVPDAKTIEVWDRFYYPNVVRKEDVAVDSEEVRKYFPYTAVKEGVLALYGELFGLTFRPVKGAVVWHPSVELWEMLEGNDLKGRFWLDMHPREDKFKHAAQFSIQTGTTAPDRTPWAALVCNFPAPSETDKALMGHEDVVTFFHEFGHLIHHLMARGPTVKLATELEGDFIEAPSQLLEEWAWDPAILARFSGHAETGARIPAELVVAMKKADGFGRGLEVMRQIYLSAYSWHIYQADPAGFDPDAFTTAMYEKYSPYPRPAVDNLWANFGHLTDYSSNYYTYQWSLAIAKDLFTRFAAGGLLDTKTALAYRDTILAAGATADAATLVERFLGRPQNLEAYRNWLMSE